jgi:hypothetical protein
VMTGWVRYRVTIDFTSHHNSISTELYSACKPDDRCLHVCSEDSIYGPRSSSRMRYGVSRFRYDSACWKIRKLLCNDCKFNLPHHVFRQPRLYNGERLLCLDEKTPH